MPITPIDHPLPEVDFGRVGPPMGQRFPNLVLPNQRGDLIDLDEVRGSRRALVVIHRSVVW